MKRVNDVGGKTFVKEKSENVVAVMAGGLKSYFYFGQIRRCGFDFLEKQLETVQIVLNGKNIRQDFSV